MNFSLVHFYVVKAYNALMVTKRKSTGKRFILMKPSRIWFCRCTKIYPKFVKLQQVSIIKNLLSYGNKNIREFSEQNFLLL